MEHASGTHFTPGRHASLSNAAAVVMWQRQQGENGTGGGRAHPSINLHDYIAHTNTRDRRIALWKYIRNTCPRRVFQRDDLRVTPQCEEVERARCLGGCESPFTFDSVCCACQQRPRHSTVVHTTRVHSGRWTRVHWGGGGGQPSGQDQRACLRCFPAPDGGWGLTPQPPFRCSLSMSQSMVAPLHQDMHPPQPSLGEHSTA